MLPLSFLQVRHSQILSFIPSKSSLSHITHHASPLPPPALQNPEFTTEETVRI
jgi:hypothetical protein